MKRTSRFAEPVSECGGTWCEPHQESQLKIISELQAEALSLSKGSKQAEVVLRYQNRTMVVVHRAPREPRTASAGNQSGSA